MQESQSECVFQCGGSHTSSVTVVLESQLCRHSLRWQHCVMIAGGLLGNEVNHACFCMVPGLLTTGQEGTWERPRCV